MNRPKPPSPARSQKSPTKIWSKLPKPDIARLTTVGDLCRKASQMGPQDAVEWHGRMLRAWQLTLLRFAVTLDNVDRLNVMAIAREIDRGGRAREDRTEFNFFRRTSA